MGKVDPGTIRSITFEKYLLDTIFVRKAFLPLRILPAQRFRSVDLIQGILQGMVGINTAGLADICLHPVIEVLYGTVFIAPFFYIIQLLHSFSVSQTFLFLFRERLYFIL